MENPDAKEIQRREMAMKKATTTRKLWPVYEIMPAYHLSLRGGFSRQEMALGKKTAESAASSDDEYMDSVEY
uniref:Uncharacterized protein n=1 Tax=Psilocybe cubensis TaxID=181762 RepID=A0A8H7XJ89_PSICU